MSKSCGAAWLTLAALLCPAPAAAAPRVLDGRLHHLRAGGEREWSDFPARAEGPSLSLRSRSERNAAEQTLCLRQQDVRQTWKVLLNGKELGRLPPDENDMVIYLAVPSGALIAGENYLAIEQVGRTPDDVRIGEISLDDRPVRAALAEATVNVSVLDTTDTGKPVPVPARLTVLNAQGALMTVGAASGGELAVRPGVVYTGDGRARFGLPAGDYTLYAGRGFEYGLDSVRLTLRPGDVVRKTLTIRREVPTPGYAACDPHVHTLTYSGHGDATIDERVITLAGEGVELPVAAEHNRQVDYHAAAVRLGVRKHFTPIVGNEVTTAVGHFNVFPLRVQGPLPDFRHKDWKSLFASIHDCNADGVVILNHPRDRHSGFRPFGPERFNAATGEDLDGWVLRANALEVVNSGAHQTDLMRPLRDWFALLNRGLAVAPVGASDSHDVARYLVGQGRAYVRCQDADPGAIDVAEVVKSFRAGRVLVSCGLLAEIAVNAKYGPGDLVPSAGDVKVAVRVLGPSWVTADRVELYANGVKIREAAIPAKGKGGVLWSGEWTLPRFKHDVHLVAVASGPGVTGLYWPIARPYQATSPVVRRRVIGITGAVWIDGDGDGKKTSAYGYARRLIEGAWPSVPKVIAGLRDHDEAVAAQAAGLLQGRGIAVQEPALRAAAKRAGAHVERGFSAYIEARRESDVARSQRR
jgi:hypothetical protein